MHGRHSLQSLKRLFRRYNNLYFYNQLPSCTIHLGPVLGGIVQWNNSELLGFCDDAKREISIDLEKHDDGEQVRGTLLHEMIHLRAEGHGNEFWSEADRVLGLGAPSVLVDVGSDVAEDLAKIIRTSDHDDFRFVKRALRRRMRAECHYGFTVTGPQFEALREIRFASQM